MKKLFLSLIMLLPFLSSAQVYVMDSTTTRYPTVGRFSYTGPDTYSGYPTVPHFTTRNYSGIAMTHQFWAQDNNDSPKFFNLSFNAGTKIFSFSGQQNDAKVYIKHNVGIGTNAPTQRLHVYGPGIVKSMVESSNNHAYFLVQGAVGKGAFVDYHRAGDGRIWHTGLRNSNNNFEFRLNDQSAVLTLRDDGSVGVGTSSTFGYRLAVNGKIGTTEINVENSSAWPDFVFKEEYRLLSLEEVETHIIEKGHLPEIPTEAEVAENGINLGEMNGKLLQKIEELTLYMIDMNKQLKSQSENMEQLKVENAALKKEVAELKN